jgi:hypothetical protein
MFLSLGNVEELAKKISISGTVGAPLNVMRDCTVHFTICTRLKAKCACTSEWCGVQIATFTVFLRSTARA